MLEFDKASRRQIEQEHQLSDLVARIEEINSRLENQDFSPAKGENLDIDTIVTELENGIRYLQTRLA